jgi:biopolymer transport protein ExbD
MSFVPIEELKEREGMTFAPMIDFLFLMLAFFASLAVTRMAMKDTDINLVKAKSEKISSALRTERDCKLIHISVLENGRYKWVTEIRDHPMQTAAEIANELQKQYQKGLLPEEKSDTKVLLKIDKNARWEPVLKALVAIKDCGFEARPVYEPETTR